MHVYKDISKRMGDEGYSRTFQQCGEKIKKLRQEYKKVKDKLHKTGEKYLIAKFEHCDLLNDILGNKPATHPPGHTH